MLNILENKYKLKVPLIKTLFNRGILDRLNVITIIKEYKKLEGIKNRCNSWNIINTWACGQNLRPKLVRRKTMFAYEDKLKAIRLYLKYESYATAINELGYTSRGELK